MVQICPDSMHSTSNIVPGPSCRGVLAGLPHTTYRLPLGTPWRVQVVYNILSNMSKMYMLSFRHVWWCKIKSVDVT